MDLTQRYDPELIGALEAFPIEAMINWDDLPAGREFGKKMFEALRANIPDSPHVAKQDRTVPRPEGAPQVPIRIYRPIQSAGTLPGLFWILGIG